MTEEWWSDSFCVSSSDSGRFTEFGEFQDLDEETDYNQKQCDTVANRFIICDSRKSHANSAIGVFLKNLESIPIDPFLDPIFSTCFNCWQFGHGYRDCHLPNQHKFCVNCGRMNLLIDSCPRCGRAYHHYMYSKTLKRQKPVVSFPYHLGCNYYNKEVEDDITQLDTMENYSENGSMSFSKISITNLSEDQCYYLSEESENCSDNVFVDEDMKSHQTVSQLLSDFLKLLNDVKHWPMEVQNTILLHFATQRRNQSVYQN